MYNKNTEYNVKYVTKDGKEETKQITPEEDMSKPQMIIKLKEEDKNFFKLLEDFEYITPEELKKLHKDYKSTVGDIIRFSKYRGEDPEEVRQRYKDLGYDETDPMIVTSDGKGGTILKPVKVKKEESKMSKTLFDYLEEHSFEGVDIQDTVYDMTCWFEFTIEDADSDPFDMFMSKLAKSLHIDFEDVNKTVVVDLTNWVTKNYDKLEEIFDLSGEDKESNIEEIVGSIMPGLLSGYATDSVYKELADNMITESKELKESDEENGIIELGNDFQTILDKDTNSYRVLYRGSEIDSSLKDDEYYEACKTLDGIKNFVKKLKIQTTGKGFAKKSRIVKESDEENEDEFEELENLDEEVTDVEEEKEETLDESIKPEDDNGDYNYFYSPRQIIEICEDRKYEHTFDEESGTIEELEKELQDIKRIESEKPITTIEEPLTDKYPGWKNCKVKTILKDGREFVSEEDTLSVWAAVQLVVATEVINESWNKEIKDGLNDGWYSDGTSLYAKTRDDMLNVIDFMESEGNITKRGAELVTNKINQLSISEDKNIRIEFPEGQMKDLIIYIADANGKNEEMVDAIEDFYDIEDEAMAENKKLNEDKDEDEKEETLDEVINRAHQEEISAIDTYDTVLSKTNESTDAKLIEMINEIKKDEEDHKTLLQHYIETGEVWTDEDLEKGEEEDVEVEEEQENKEDLEESKQCIKEELPKQAPLDSLLYMVTEATNITELEKIADSLLDSELKEDLLECIDDEDAKAYGEDIYFNTVKLNMQNIIEDYMDEQ